MGITGNADTPVFWKRLDASGDLVLISNGLGVGRHSVIDIVGLRLIMVTTAGAANGRVVTLDLNQRDSGWQVLVPEQSAAVIQGASVIGGRLVVTYTRHAASEIWIVPLDASGPKKPLSLPGVGSVLDLDTVTVKGEPDSPEFGFLFSSLSTPPAVYRASVNGGAPILEMQAWDNSPLRPTAFERVEFPSKDGTRVGMFVLRRTDLNPEPRPLLVFAYGGFGVSMLPWEHVEAVPWVQAGGIFALVNTRGGSVNGEDWHRQAMGANKRRAFEDLDAAVEHLVARGDAARGKAVALGISNGGLVVTATSLLWPDHYAAVIALVPVTDLVRSHLIGQGFLWTEEFGVKNYENSAYHMALVHEYARPLPRTLVTMAREDDRTTPIHAAK